MVGNYIYGFFIVMILFSSQLKSEESLDEAEILKEQGNNFLYGKSGENVDIDKGIQLLKDAFQLGSSSAALILANEYLNGGQVENNCIEGLMYANQAKDSEPSAYALLAQEYDLGRCVPHNKALSISFLRKGVDSNDPTSITLLGVWYFFGINVEKNDKESFDLFSRAAKLGDCVGQNYLGTMYENGVHVKIDLKQAFEIYSKSVSEGCGESLKSIGYFYYSGKAVKQNFEEAYSYFHRAMQRGDVEAKARVATSLLTGTGVKKNINLGIELLIEAAKQGDSGSQYILSVEYYNGKNIEENLEKSRYWAEQSALQTDSWGQSWLGFHFEFGYGGDLDLIKAEELYKQSMNQATFSKERLAAWYTEGKFYTKDHTAARLILESALKHSDDEIVAQLGELLSCSSNDDVRDANRAQKFIEERIKDRLSYTVKLKLALAASYSEQSNFDGALDVMETIETSELLEIYSEEETKLRFHDRIELYKNYQPCRF